MASIQQAAKWMQEGKRVTRPNARGSGFFAVSHPLAEDEGFIHWHRADDGEQGMADLLEPEDLLADDWEIAQ